jgi:uncharacterized protein (TIGR03435 family)
LGFEVQVDGERRKGRESPNGSNGEGPRAEAAVPDEGLRWEERKQPMPIIVIDHIEKPSDN